MKKVLVIQAARFGDIIQTARLIKSLARSCETHLAVDASFKILVQALFPEVIVHCFPFHQPVAPASLPGLEQEFKKIAALDFAQIFNCNFSPLSTNLSRLFPENKVTGLRPGHFSSGDILRSRWARLGFCLTGRRKITSLNLVDYWGWFHKNPIPPEFVNPPAAPGGEGLGVILAGREARRSLQPAIFARIVSVAASILKVRTIHLFGTERDVPVANQFRHALSPEMRNKVVDLCGKTGWLELIAKIENLDLLLTPDTGTMHLAAFLGTPVMAFFLSSAWCHETGPYGQGHLIWQANTGCAPCVETAPCKHSVRCLDFFQDASFTRYVAAALTKNEKILSNLPDGLQLWKTDFDGAGQILKLAGGVDGQAGERLLTRKLINAFLLREDAGLSGFNNAEIAGMTEYLFPDADWMLPSARYY